MSNKQKNETKAWSCTCIIVLLRKPNRSFWSITGDSMSIWNLFYKENLISVASLRTKWEQWEVTDMWANLKDRELGIQKKFGSKSITLLRGNHKIPIWGKFLKDF